MAENDAASDSGHRSDAFYEAVAKDLSAYDAEQRHLFGEIDENLIAAYLSDRCTPEERAGVERAMRAYPAVREWVALAGRATSDRKPALAMTARRAWIAAAAAVVVAVTIGFLAYNRRASPADQVASLERRARALQGTPPGAAPVRELRGDLLASPIEVAALAWHSDTLLDFMARTRPPSPAEIEAEFGPQVDRVMAAVAALPETKRKGPGVVLTSLPAQQGDYAERVYDRLWQHAGSTGRKLSPKLESFLLNARRPGERVGMIVPIYAYEMDASERKSWDEIVALASPSLPVKIVNTRRYTEGFVPTEAYDRAIEHAHAAGVEVYAYVNCNGGQTDEQTIEAELRHWHEAFRGRFSGVYFDNQSMYDDSRLDYFARVFRLARRIDPGWKIISATDGGCNEAFAKILEDSIICYKTNGTFPKFQGWEHKYRRERFAALIHHAERLDAAGFTQAAAVFGWAYATGKPEADNPYRRLPPFMAEEAAMLKTLNGDEPAPGRGLQAGNLPSLPRSRVPVYRVRSTSAGGSHAPWSESSSLADHRRSWSGVA